MRKVLVPVLLSTFLLFTPSTFGQQVNVQGGVNLKEKIQVENNVNISSQTITIWGKITSIKENTFVIADETITIDPSKVSKFTQKGIITVGAKAKVKAIVINGTAYATDINIIGTGQGRFQIKAKNGQENKTEVKEVKSMTRIVAFFKQMIDFFVTANARASI